jgi:hypothetical protein
VAAWGSPGPNAWCKGLIRDEFERVFAYKSYKVPERERMWTAAMLKEVRKLIKTNAAVTLQRIIDTMVGRGCPRISDSTLSRYLATEIITYKSVTRHNHMRNAPATKTLRRGYVAKAKQHTQAGRLKVYYEP